MSANPALDLLKEEGKIGKDSVPVEVKPADPAKPVIRLTPLILQNLPILQSRVILQSLLFPSRLI